jgi:NADPH:quinone reductase-like Zn-dependent oxidoreductase
MKAVRLHDYGGPELYNYEDVPIPEPGEGQVLVKMKAIGVNPADWKYGFGYYKQYVPLQFPWTPGLDGAGIVEAIGPGVTLFKPGQAVYGFFQGPYAEFAIANATELLGKPDSLTFEQAASLPVGMMTAWEAVVEVAEVKPGQRVLVHGGAGGVGLHAVQLAKWKGAHVTATASGANADFVRSLGADKVVDYTKSKFEDEVRDVDAVIDTVGGELVQRSIPIIKPGGIFVTIAAMVDPELGEARGVRAASAARAGADKLPKAGELVAEGKLKPQVGNIYSLAQASQAITESQTGHTRGRIILKPD